ncbi:VOC family protein [Spiractinospora alimapuensis]|uniref:VOC family protein n=1 Tax=Spiractinospora alimapuensis TaxID=2820884 RepID=UPI001F3E1857|nr:VOC family protein [Spiractinospora alimapuensis]QVQ53404.1 VOC family protein [Spiractinospora alimapuensis]
MTYIQGSHHVTLSVGHAQEDVDFHTRLLGLRFIKKTVLYDGSTPVYHLYYSNATGEASSVITTFAWAQHGIHGTRGTNQAREVLLSVPEESLNYWEKRFREHGIDATNVEVFERRRILFHHPSGIEYALVGNIGDPRRPYAGNGVPEEYGIHGIHGTAIHAHTPERTVEFAESVFHSEGHITEDGHRAAFQVGNDKFGNFVEVVGNRKDEQGTWSFGAGTYHHFAWNAESLENQLALRFTIEGAGYTDISELKDRTYFKSVYCRMPGGALFELAVTHDEGGWDCDESPEELGQRFMLPPQFEAEREQIMSQLEPIVVDA